MSATKNSPAFQDMMEEQRREENNSYEIYQDHAREQSTTPEWDTVVDFTRPEGLAEAVEKGNMNPLEAWVEYKRLEDQIATCKERIKAAAITEAAKYGKDEKVYGAKVSVTYNGARYSYDHIPRWKELKDELDRIQSTAQNAYKAKAMVVVSADGEEIPAAGYTPGKESLTIKLMD
jgi:hypothetical protein